jgi:hypothetical protein
MGKGACRIGRQVAKKKREKRQRGRSLHSELEAADLSLMFKQLSTRQVHCSLNTQKTLSHILGCSEHFLSNIPDIPFLSRPRKRHLCLDNVGFRQILYSFLYSHNVKKDNHRLFIKTKMKRRILDYALIKLGPWIHRFAVATRATLVGFSGENLGFMLDIASYDGFVSLFFVFVFAIFISAREAGFKAGLLQRP